MHPKFVFMMFLLPALELATATPLVTLERKSALGSRPSLARGSSTRGTVSQHNPVPDLNPAPPPSVKSPTTQADAAPGVGNPVQATAPQAPPKSNPPINTPPSLQPVKGNVDTQAQCKRSPAGCDTTGKRKLDNSDSDPSGPAHKAAKTADPKTVDLKTADPKTADPKTADPKTADPKTVDPKTVDPSMYKPGGGPQLDYKGGVRGDQENNNGNYNWHQGTFKTPPGFNEDDMKKALSEQGGHLTNAYKNAKDTGLKKTEMPGDLTATHVPDRPNDPNCTGTLCMHTSERLQSKPDDKNEGPHKPESVIQDQKSDAVTNNGGHGEVGAIANQRQQQGMKELDKNGKPTRFRDGSMAGSVNLPNNPQKGNYDPAKVVPQSACKGSENCNQVLQDTNLRDIFKDAHTNTIKDTREKQTEPWDPKSPNAAHPWAQGPGGAQWKQKRDNRLLRRGGILKQRAILRRIVDDFALQQRHLAWDATARDSIGMLSARDLGLTKGTPSFGAIAATA